VVSNKINRTNYTTVPSRIIKLAFTLINVFYYNNPKKPDYIELYITFIIIINSTEEFRKTHFRL
jgi:hypothetical protein